MIGTHFCSAYLTPEGAKELEHKFLCEQEQLWIGFLSLESPKVKFYLTKKRIVCLFCQQDLFFVLSLCDPASGFGVTDERYA
jgi:hypothetical protein